MSDVDNSAEDNSLSQNNSSQNHLDKGRQPFAELMQQWNITTKDIVTVEELPQITYKQVKRAAEGRVLTLRMMMKMTQALNIVIWKRLDDQQKETYFEYGWKHLFTYAKGYDASFIDPNLSLIAELNAADEE